MPDILNGGGDETLDKTLDKTPENIKDFTPEEQRRVKDFIKEQDLHLHLHPYAYKHSERLVGSFTPKSGLDIFDIENLHGMPLLDIIKYAEQYLPEFKGENVSRAQFLENIFDFVAKNAEMIMNDPEFSAESKAFIVEIFNVNKSVKAGKIQLTKNAKRRYVLELLSGENIRMKEIQEADLSAINQVLLQDLTGDKLVKFNKFYESIDGLDKNYFENLVDFLNSISSHDMTEDSKITLKKKIIEARKKSTSTSDKKKEEFNNDRNALKEILYKFVRKNAIDSKKILASAEKNKTLFDDILLSALGEKLENGNYKLNLKGRVYEVSVELGPIKTYSSVDKKLKNKGLNSTIKDVVRGRIFIVSPVGATDEMVTELTNMILVKFINEYENKELIGDLKIKGSSISDVGNRPGLAITGELQAKDAKYPTTIEVSVIDSVHSLVELNLGRKNHEFYAWKKDTLRKAETYLSENAITINEIKWFVQTLLNDKTFLYKEKVEEIKEILLNEILKDLTLYEDKYYSANYIIRNRWNNINNSQQAPLRKSVIKRISLKARKALIHQKIEDIIYTRLIKKSAENLKSVAIEKTPKEIISSQYIAAKEAEAIAMRIRRMLDTYDLNSPDLRMFLEETLSLSETEITDVLDISTIEKENLNEFIANIVDGEINTDSDVSKSTTDAITLAIKQEMLPSEFVRRVKKMKKIKKESL